jgi:hypothetical protein
MCVTSFLFVSAVPLELSFRSGLDLVAGLRAQQLPDKAAQLPGDGYDRLVALESPGQQSRVATVQAVLGAPTDVPHLSRLRLLPPAQLLTHLRRRRVMLGTLHQ